MSNLIPGVAFATCVRASLKAGFAASLAAITPLSAFADATLAG